MSRLLEEAARGLGAGSRELLHVSQTEVGTLAVKEAAITVDFEMTSRASETEDGVGLGAKTLTFFTKETDRREINRAHIEMRIVAVPPSAPEKGGKDAPGLDPDVARFLALLEKDPSKLAQLKAVMRHLEQGAGDAPGKEGKPPAGEAKPAEGRSRDAKPTEAKPAESTARLAGATPARPAGREPSPAPAAPPAPAPAAPEKRPPARAPAKAPPPPPAPPREAPRKPAKPAPRPARATASGATRAQMEEAVRLLGERLLVPEMPAPLHEALAHDLAGISGLLQADRLEDAEAALQRFALTYAEVFQAFGGA